MVCNICFIEDDILTTPICNSCSNKQIEDWFIKYLDQNHLDKKN
jgi:hypothetical protein